MLAGSKSKGRRKYYSYYHCSKGCTNRLSAKSVNEKFIKELRIYAPRLEYKKLYTILIVEAYNEQTKERQVEKTRLKNLITDYQTRLSKARNLLIIGQIDASDYREIKSDYGSSLLSMQAKYSELNDEKDNIEKLLDSGIENLYRLGYIYENSNLVPYRDLIGSIYPENFVFDGIGFRTAKINEATRLIRLTNSYLDVNKKKRQIRIFLFCLLWWSIQTGSCTRKEQ